MLGPYHRCLGGDGCPGSVQRCTPETPLGNDPYPDNGDIRWQGRRR
jgi:hypothetical protein